MNKLLKKLIIVMLLISVSFAVTSCDNLLTMFGKTTSTEVETTITPTSSKQTTIANTTVEQTTVEITTVPNTTFETTVYTTIETTVNTTTQTTVTTTYTDGAILEVTSPTKIVYEVYDELNLDGIIVTFNDTVLQDTEYTVSDVDMTTYGNKQVFINYNTYQTSFIIDVNLPTYFLSATDLTGEDLLLELRSIINQNFNSRSYTFSSEVFQTSDEDPNIPGNVIFFYSGESISGGWNGDFWSREHVWPKSFFVDQVTGNYITYAYSDLHNLKPSHRDANSYRGNCYYDNINYDDMSAYNIDKFNQYNIMKIGDAVEPRDEIKGDIARIFFYMLAMYEELSLVDSVPLVDNLEMGLYSVILEWNDLDPVDDFERNRNEVIFSYQNNYNPFISYPGFIDLIWE